MLKVLVLYYVLVMAKTLLMTISFNSLTWAGHDADLYAATSVTLWGHGCNLPWPKYDPISVLMMLCG